MLHKRIIILFQHTKHQSQIKRSIFIQRKYLKYYLRTFIYFFSIIKKMVKIYNIDEYGTNLSPEIYDPKTLTQDNNYFYENLGFSNNFIYNLLFF